MPAIAAALGGPDLTKLAEKKERSLQFLRGNSDFPFDRLSG